MDTYDDITNDEIRLKGPKIKRSTLVLTQIIVHKRKRAGAAIFDVTCQFPVRVDVVPTSRQKRNLTQIRLD